MAWLYFDEATRKKWTFQFLGRELAIGFGYGFRTVTIGNASNRHARRRSYAIIASSQTGMLIYYVACFGFHSHFHRLDNSSLLINLSHCPL